MTEEIKASHILVETREEAEKIKEEILSGKPFDEAAMEYSLCPSGQEGGDLGFFGRNVMVVEFDHAAFSLKVGDMSDPIQTNFGWHLILVTDKQCA